MNVTKLFLGAPGDVTVTHVRSSTARVSRTSDELRANVANACAGLREVGVRPGDRVLILCGSRIEALESILATFNIGATAMPVTPLLGAANLEGIIEGMRPRCCIFEDPPEPRVQRALTEQRCTMIGLKTDDSPLAARWHSYRHLVSGHAPLEFPSWPDDQPALVIHSSGSTGRPKAVVMDHGALLRYFEYHDLIWRQYSDGPDTLSATSMLVIGLPLTHLAGLTVCLQGLMHRRPVCLMSLFLPDVYLKLIESTRCATPLLVPSLYRSLMKEPYLARMDRSALRFCITGGEGVTAELAEQVRMAFGVPLVTAYSMTECLSGIGHSRHDLFAGRVKPASCGRQMFGESSLRDAEGNVTPSYGELWVRNATVHRCYFDDEANASRLQGGWFRTGDLFYKDADGDYFHRGRVDDMFICNGKNIYPLEIELMLMRHPAVELVCAAPVSCGRKGTIPAVLIVPRQPLSSADVQDFSMRNGPSHVIPQFIKFVDSLPQLGAGKVDRRAAVRVLQEAYDAVEA